MSDTEHVTPSIETVKVTPEMARDWLTNHNDSNRIPREQKINGYARDMLAGQWQFNGVPILFDAGGTLIDGQHRLRALIKADVTLEFLIIRNLPASVQQTVDIGATRTMGVIRRRKKESAKAAGRAPEPAGPAEADLLAACCPDYCDDCPGCDGPCHSPDEPLAAFVDRILAGEGL